MKKHLLIILLGFGLVQAEEQKNTANFYCEIEPSGASEDYWVDACPNGSTLYYTITRENVNAVSKEMGLEPMAEELVLFDFEARASLFIAKNCDLSNNLISKTIGYGDLLRHKVICTKTARREKLESGITFDNIFNDKRKKQ